MPRAKMAGAEFQIDERTDPDGYVRLVVRGELDVAVADQLGGAVDRLRSQGANVRLDLSQLGFIDSSGLRVLITAKREAVSNGWAFEIDRNVSSPTRRLFELAGVEVFIWGAD